MKRLLSVMVTVIILLIASGCNERLNANNCPGVEIEWVDFLLINDITYYYQPEANLDPHATAGDEIGIVTYKLAEQACSDHRSENGDAAFLPEGTKIYEYQGYLPTFRVIAITAEGNKVYEVNRNPTARRVRDLYDIEHKIHRISLKEGKIILSESETEEFTKLFLDSEYVGFDKIYKTRIADPVSITIKLLDETSVNLTYWLRPEPAMQPGILVSDGMRSIIEGKLNEAGYLAE